MSTPEQGPEGTRPGLIPAPAPGPARASGPAVVPGPAPVPGPAVVPGQGLSATVLGAPMSAFGRVAATRPDTGQPPAAEPVAVPRVAPGPVAPPLAPVAWPIVPLNAGLLPAEPVARAARSPAAVPPHVLADVALPLDEPPPEEPAPGAPGNISRPIRAAAAMAGVLLVGAALAAAAGSGHTTPAPPSAPRMAVFHSSDHDMDRFWHAG